MRYSEINLNVIVNRKKNQLIESRFFNSLGTADISEINKKYIDKVTEILNTSKNEALADWIRDSNHPISKEQWQSIFSDSKVQTALASWLERGIKTSSFDRIMRVASQMKFISKLVNIKFQSEISNKLSEDIFKISWTLFNKYSTDYQVTPSIAELLTASFKMGIDVATPIQRIKTKIIKSLLERMTPHSDHEDALLQNTLEMVKCLITLGFDWTELPIIAKSAQHELDSKNKK